MQSGGDEEKAGLHVVKKKCRTENFRNICLSVAPAWTHLLMLITVKEYTCA